MNKLKVTSNKAYHFGFVLTEQELRRFVDIIIDQVKKDNNEEIEISFSLIYENGVVAVTDNIEDVLAEENSGSAKILELSILIFSEDKRQVRLEFANTDSDNVVSNISIKYNINALTRDWVFITSSILDERIKKIKRFNINTFLGSKRNRSLYSLIVPVAFFITLIIPTIYGIAESEKNLNSIRTDWKNNDLTDPVEAIIRLQEVNISLQAFDGIKYGIIGIIILVFIYIILNFYLQKTYPSYNFCWGDYIEEFKRKNSIRKTINIVIIIGLFVSIVAGLIVEKINI